MVEQAQQRLFAHGGLSPFAFGLGQGLVFAIGFDADGTGRDLEVKDAEQRLAQRRGVVWIHLDLNTTPAKHWVETQGWLPDGAKEWLLTRETYARIETTAQGVTGILTDFCHELEAVDWRPGHLHFYADDHAIVTARRHPLAAVERARKAVAQGVTATTGLSVLVRIVESLGRLLEGATDALERSIEQAEDQIERDEPERLRQSLGEVRKRAILLYRHLHREERVFSRLCAKPPPWICSDDLAGLREGLEYLGRTAEDLDTVQLRSRLLQDELAARLAEATNRNVYVLSILSAVLLPMSLIAGMFGMNLGGLPGLNSPLGFWVVSLVIVVVGGLTLLILRWRKIL